MMSDASSELIVFDRQLIAEGEYWVSRLSTQAVESDLHPDSCRVRNITQSGRHSMSQYLATCTQSCKS